jgi:hypothetical protein
MPPLHPPSATSTAPDVNAKLNALHPRLGNLGLKLRYGFALFQPASASGTAVWQRHFHNFIDLLGDRPTTSPSVVFPCFASGLLRLGFGFLT